MRTYLDTLNEDNIVVIENFVSVEICLAILEELQFVHWGDSVVVTYNGNEHSPAYIDSKLRKSETAGQIWFSDDLNRLLKKIEKKIALLLDTSTNRFEEWQANKYGVNDRFDFHVDCGNWEGSEAGERKRTFLLYLDTPAKGGETYFRALDKKITAIAGRLVIWNNLLPSGKCNFGMIHSGLPVKKGSKTILVSWERMRALRRISNLK